MKHHDESDRPVKDVVCGMRMSRKTAPIACNHDGRTYYFCCDMCREKFERSPQRYLAACRHWAHRRHAASA